MTVTLKSIEKSEYKLNDINIREVFNQKYVGVIYDLKMSFNPHIDYIIEKSLKVFINEVYVTKSQRQYMDKHL